MTIPEAITALSPRIGWKDDKTDSVTLTAPTTTSDSGFYFNDAHPAITLQNIRDCQPVIDIKDVDFIQYLDDLKARCIREVLFDAFEKDVIEDDILTVYPQGFDKALLLKMAIIVGEIIMTAVRSNRVQRFTTAFAGKLNYDLYREAPNKFAIRGANYIHTLGVATRYGFELESLRRRFGQTRNLLKVVTKGQAIDESHAGKYLGD